MQTVEKCNNYSKYSTEVLSQSVPSRILSLKGRT